MYKTILLAFDANQPEGQAKSVQAAIEEARRGQASLHVVSVLPEFGMSIVGSYFPEGFEAKMVEEADQRLAGWAEASLPKDIETHHHVVRGKIYEEILRAAQVIGADLIVMSAHSPDLKDYLLGPNAARVVRHATCSVLVVRE